MSDNIITITDFMDPNLDVYARLTENQLLNRANPKEGMFIAESPKVIERALDVGCEPVSLLMETKHVNGEARGIIERCQNIPVYTASFDLLTKLTGFALTRGTLCAMYRPKPRSVEEVCRDARRVAVLEDVVNPTNVGAIFRSAAALHIDAVLLTPACSNPLYRRAIRVSMGTVFQVPWAYFSKCNVDSDSTFADTSLHDRCDSHEPDSSAYEGYIGELHRLGFKTCAMALTDDSVSIDDPVLRSEERLAIVLGTEGDGLHEQTIASCDYTVKIPMSHGVDSLNVAAASAVAFWELAK